MAFTISKVLTIIRQGWTFYRAITPYGRLWPTRDYLHWRLGTVYGSFLPDGRPKPVSDLLLQLWQDKEQVAKFLLWRRSMLPYQKS